MSAGGESGRARPRRRATVVGAVGLALVAGVAAVAATSSSQGDGGATSEPTATAAIERRDLVERETVDGTLGYADERAVPNRRSGTVTWLPSRGAVVRANARLYEVDGEAVYLLDGRVPAYRALAPGTDGDDVRALERNLDALGFDPYGAMTVDGDWDAGTTAAVERWQDAHGLQQTGTIELGRVVFAPGARRVAELGVDVGASAGADGASAAAGEEFMTTTSTRKIVTVDLETTKGSVARRGARVTVELPSGDIAHGRITHVASTADVQTNADGSSEPPTIALQIALRGRAPAIDQAPVSVQLERDRARDVLAVPVTALLARQGGRFAVEVVEGARRRTVPVTTGLFTSGFVAIEGAGLRPGMRVADARV